MHCGALWLTIVNQGKTKTHLGRKIDGLFQLHCFSCIGSVLNLTVMVKVMRLLKHTQRGWSITKHWSSHPIRAHCAFSEGRAV